MPKEQGSHEWSALCWVAGSCNGVKQRGVPKVVVMVEQSLEERAFLGTGSADLTQRDGHQIGQWDGDGRARFGQSRQAFGAHAIDRNASPGRQLNPATPLDLEEERAGGHLPAGRQVSLSWPAGLRQSQSRARCWLTLWRLQSGCSLSRARTCASSASPMERP